MLYLFGSLNMHPTVNIAVRAARAAGDVILRYHNQVDLLTIENKSINDFVSEVDKTAEKAIINEIKKAFPKHSILAEESGEILGDNNFQWIIDPLDGTTNYLHGFPQYAVSIALLENQIPTHAVIYDPFKEELFTASKGEGAYLNDERIRVTMSNGLEDTQIGTGFPFKHPQHLRGAYRRNAQFTQRSYTPKEQGWYVRSRYPTVRSRRIGCGYSDVGRTG